MSIFFKVFEGEVKLIFEQRHELFVLFLICLIDDVVLLADSAGIVGGYSGINLHNGAT